jgi:hypothetical protein
MNFCNFKKHWLWTYDFKFCRIANAKTLCAIDYFMKQISILIFIVFISKSSLSQANEEYITWDSSSRLTIEDFQLRKADSTHLLYYGAFIIYFQQNVFKFGYNYNKNVKAQMIKSGSWLDTTTHPKGQLRILQDEFDIYEIYARHFRKMLNNEHNLNRKKLKQIYSNLTIELNARLESFFYFYQLATNQGKN